MEGGFPHRRRSGGAPPKGEGVGKGRLLKEQKVGWARTKTRSWSLFAQGKGRGISKTKGGHGAHRLAGYFVGIGRQGQEVGPFEGIWQRKGFVGRGTWGTAIHGVGGRKRGYLPQWGI